MKKYISILFTMFLIFSVHAQSADVITEILDSDEVTFGQVCYMSAVEQGLVSEDSSFESAIQVLADNGQLPSIVDADTPIPAVDLVFLMSQMSSWDINGGLLYRLTKGSPRYTFKQFKTDGIISQTQSPDALVNGYDFMNIFVNCSRIYGGFDIDSVDMEEE